MKRLIVLAGVLAVVASACLAGALKYYVCKQLGLEFALAPGSKAQSYPNARSGQAVVAVTDKSGELAVGVYYWAETAWKKSARRFVRDRVLKDSCTAPLAVKPRNTHLGTGEVLICLERSNDLDMVYEGHIYYIPYKSHMLEISQSRERPMVVHLKKGQSFPEWVKERKIVPLPDAQFPDWELCVRTIRTIRKR